MIFSDLKTLVAERLNESDLFVERSLQAIPENAGDLLTRVEKDLALGMCLVVDMGEIQHDLYEGTYTVELRVVGTEDVLINRSSPRGGPALGDVLEGVVERLCDAEWYPAVGWSQPEHVSTTAPEQDETGRITMGAVFRLKTTARKD